MSAALRLTLAWAILMAATLLSVGVSGLEHGAWRYTAAVVMVVAAFKVRIVLWRFMELHDGPLAFRVYFSLWLLTCAGTIAGFFYAT